MDQIGNKCDLKSQRQVDMQRAAEFAQKNKMTFLETSALDATNVEKAFDVLLEGAVGRCHVYPAALTRRCRHPRARRPQGPHAQHHESVDIY